MSAAEDRQTQPAADFDPAQQGSYSIELGDLLFQGAESRVYRCSFFGKPAVYKHRFVKRYRNPTLDERLRVQRTRHEARALERCLKKGIRTPRLLGADYINTFLVMSYEEGLTVKEALDREHATAAAATAAVTSSPPSSTVTPTPVTAALLKSIGVVVALLHNANMVHGDLTTSNFILSSETPTEAEVTVAAQTSMAAERLTEETSKGRKAAKAEESPAPAHPPPSPSDPFSQAPHHHHLLALPTAQDIVVLDFGLISDKYSAEERAVDLYVLERAIASTHPYVAAFASEVILEGYRSAADPKKGAETLKRLEAVRARGRKRSMVG